ncbi:MAG: zinc ribbon domain-containing protein [Candidatus Ozemobacteraceae bacterium]
MTQTSIPPAVHNLLKTQKIFLPDINYAFESACGLDGVSGESWLIITDAKEILILARPPVGDLEKATSFHVRDISRVSAIKTFLGCLQIAFFNLEEKVVSRLEVPGLQQDLWNDLLEHLEAVFSGKLKREDALSLKLSVTAISTEISFAKLGGSMVSEGFTDTPSGAASPLLGSVDSMIYHPFGAPLGEMGSVNVDPLSIDPLAIAAPTSLDVPDIDIANGSFDLPSLDSGEKDREQTQRTTKFPSSPSKKKKAVPSTKAVSERSAREPGTRCTGCGHMNKPEYQFCLSCGAELPEKKGTERRAMFAASIDSEHPPEELNIGGCISQIFTVMAIMIGLLFLLGIMGR